MPRRLFYLILLISWLTANLIFGAEVAFIDLGNLGGDEGFGPSCRALGVSSDGSAIVGESIAKAGLGITKGVEAFLWLTPGPVRGIGSICSDPFFSSARGVARQGKVVVGQYRTPLGERAFRWTTAQGMTGLGTLPNHDRSVANGVSGDGRLVIGESSSVNSGNQAFLWTEDRGIVVLGEGLPGGKQSTSALGVSENGSFVVGLARSDRDCEAFLWSLDDGMRGLGDLPGGRFDSSAHAVSRDGKVVVGQSRSQHGLEAFRWSPEAGITGLGDLEGGRFASTAHGVSSDGKRIVGQASSEDGPSAFIWTQTGGMQSIDALLRPRRLAVGWQLSQARGISADGSMIVGTGRNPAGHTAAWAVRLK